jgi:CrcB protein
MAWIAVAVGGALGSLARHAVNHAAAAQWPSLPVATAIVNLSGSLLIGLLAGLIASDRVAMPLYWREFVFVGMLGGFTTFSTFSLDTLVLARSHPSDAALNVFVQVAGSLAAAWVGYRLGSLA